MIKIPIYVCPRGCTVHHLAYTMQLRGHTQMGRVFIFAPSQVMEYCTNENATLVIRKSPSQEMT